MKDGEVAKGQWYLRLVDNDIAAPIRFDSVWSWLMERVGDLIKDEKYEEHERCSFCWRGPPTSKVKNHTAADCQLLHSFNKVRAREQLLPITLRLDSIDAVANKEPVKAERVAKDLAKKVKDLKAMIKGLESRLQVVEKQSGSKRKAEPTPSPSSPKKRKTQHKQQQATQQVPKPPTTSGSSSKKGKKKAT